MEAKAPESNLNQAEYGKSRHGLNGLELAAGLPV